MSILQQLKDDTKWQNFLNKKLESHLPNTILEQYKTFINNKQYQPLVDKIINGSYTFSTPRKIQIGKMGKTKKRTVYLFQHDENYILKMLTYLLYEYDHLFSPNLFSFRQNSGVKNAIHYITHHKIDTMYGYKVDIQNYFNSIDIQLLLPQLQKDLQDEPLYQLFHQILTKQQTLYHDEIIKEQTGAMAGVPLSTFLANYYLKDLDAYFHKQGIIYARYADDILFFANTLEQLLEYKQYLIQYLKNKHLTINTEKEYIYQPKEKIEFLGFSYENGTIDLSDNTIKKMKGKIRRTARGLRRWKLKKQASNEITLKAMNRKFNKKFYGKETTDLSWQYWFFPTITTSKSLKIIDTYMQQWQRYIITGKHNKTNYKKVPYSFLKKCNYIPLVHAYYTYKEEK